MAAKLTYDPDTGIFSKSGSISKKGYFYINIGRKSYLAHRLAWLWVYGEWPEGQIDHINRDKLDNRICNLRLASNAQNHANSVAQKSNKLGERGIHKINSGKYRVQLQSNGKYFHIGYYNDLISAIHARNWASFEIHGEYSPQ